MPLSPMPVLTLLRVFRLSWQDSVARRRVGESRRLVVGDVVQLLIASTGRAVSGFEVRFEVRFRVGEVD